MPQMFPMPFAFLMIMTLVLFLLSVVRSYWHNFGSVAYSASKGMQTSTHFNQSW